MRQCENVEMKGQWVECYFHLHISIFAYLHIVTLGLKFNRILHFYISSFSHFHIYFHFSLASRTALRSCSPLDIHSAQNARLLQMIR